MVEAHSHEIQKIKVAVRMRPLVEHELQAGHDTTKFEVTKNNEIL